MSQHVHYEVFRRQGGGGFSLVELRDHRDEAVKFAQELMKNGATGVKVVKETYNEDTGDYLSLKVFEEGHAKYKARPAQESVPASPCFRPDDLYSYHARKTIAGLIPEFLSRHKVTVTELGHRADLLEKLEATGTLLQHAIQKVAVAQASSGEIQLHKIIRSLHDLTTQVIHRVYKDTEKNRFETVEPGQFITLAEKVASNSDGRYLLNGAIVRYLVSSKGWDEKVHRLMRLMDEAHGESDGAKLLLTCIDSLISEVLTGSAGLKELVGAKDNHGLALMSLAKLFLGKVPEATEGCEGLVALTEQFAADTLPNARSAIAQRITGELRSFKRLCPSSLEDEFRMLRQIANLMVTGVGRYMSHDELVAAFVLRSSRLVTSEVLTGYLTGASPAEKLERLLFLEENIIGAENKRTLAGFVMPVVTASGFEESFQAARTPVTARLQQLESLRQRVMRSGFQENHRSEVADVIDRVATVVETRGRLFDAIDQKSGSAAEKVSAVLKLMNAGCLTEPRLGTKARTILLSQIGRPGFLASYVAQTNATTPDEVLTDLMKSLEQAGIPPEKSRQTIAA